MWSTTVMVKGMASETVKYVFRNYLLSGSKFDRVEEK